MHILIGTRNFGEESLTDPIKAAHPDVEISFCDDRARLAEAIADADAYFGWLDRKAFLAAKNLKWIQSPSTGVDGFLRIPELRESDVLLTSARGTHAACLAESALAMILAFTRGIRAFIHRQDQHVWAGGELRNTLVELTGSTLGIVGFGSVGRALAQRAQAFGMRILATDVYPNEKPDYVESLAGPKGGPEGGPEGLSDLLTASDYVVVTVPLVEETVGLIGEAELAQMKPTAILVGISRGGVIDEEALVAALQEGRLKAAALDVCQTEPLPEDSPLWDVDNLLITPHAAGGSQHEVDHVREIFLENVDRFLNGDLPLRNQIDKEQGF
jgi:phosphoglycerate dehydrogenase-like enzyme